METNSTAVTSTLSARFYEAIVSTQGVSLDSFVCFIDGGIPADPAHMKWATQQLSPEGTADEETQGVNDARSFALIANTLPMIGRPWSASTLSLGPLYRAWLNAAMVPRRPPSGPAADDAVPRRESDDRKSGIAIADAPRHDSSSGDSLDRLAALRESYDRVFGMSQTRAGDHFMPVRLTPDSLSDDVARWTRFALSTGELPRSAPLTHPMHDGGLGMPLFWFGSRGMHRTHSSGIDLSRLSISFEFTHVHIDRSSWFDSHLLYSRSWWWKGARRSAPQAGGVLFSNGAVPPDTQGALQMIPTGVIFARHLKVESADNELAESEYMFRARSSTTAGFWLFTERSIARSPLSDGHEFGRVSGSRIEIPQTQIVAVVCQLIPQEPNPEPALLPD